MSESKVVALAIVCAAVVLVALVGAGVFAGRDIRARSVECVKAGGSWNVAIDRCDNR